MKRFSLLALILCFAFLQGCKNAPTAASNKNSSGWLEATAHAPWDARYGFTGDVFNGNMWVVGGANGSGSVTNYLGDVWKSSDGKNWSETATPGFSGRYGAHVLAYNNQLFLIGGNSGGNLMNDVWSSPDGVTWTQILATNNAISSAVVGGTQFCPREDFCAVVFNNLMWVIGGTDSPVTSHGMNDVWSSPDGITWTQVLANAPLVTLANATTQPPGRWGSAVVSYNGNLFLMCGHWAGYGVNTVASDIWSSNNGSIWNHVSDTFGPVYYHQLVVNNNLMWFTCGYAPWNGGPIDNIDSSSNWTSWANAGGTTFDARFGHLSLSFKNQVWIMGGCNNTNSLTYFNDVWHSP